MSDLRAEGPDGQTARRKIQSLADARERAGLSQEQLAELIPVDRSTISRWERGTQGPIPWMRPRISRALGIGMDELGDILDEMERLARIEMGEAAVSLHKEIKRLRLEAGLSQPELATRIGYTRQYVSLAERPNKNLPSLELIGALDQCLGAGGALVELRARAKEEQVRRRGENSSQTATSGSRNAPPGSGWGASADWTGSDRTGTPLSSIGGSDSGVALDRRTFLSLATLAAADAHTAGDFAASISGGDAGPLAQVQTTYEVDRAIAAAVDGSTRSVLLRWAVDLDNSVARVNATGILAKLPGQRESDRVVAILRRDEEVRGLYLTAVASRVCEISWSQAQVFVQNPAKFPFAAIAAERLARETVSPVDAGARWCSAKLLQDLSPAIGR
ncbi:hypothetical protein GCM10010483_51570 [Actinokineospora diospyrosa]